MTPSLTDFEKLGVFYLGREYDVETKSSGEDLILYDSKDLVTHGVVLGMTGSGKTGLCIALLEEAALDGIPAIIIDPKGDIPNLLLSFPDLTAENFRPWINTDDARRKGLEPDAFAAAQAETWKSGLEKWGQSGDRIRKMRDTVDMAIYTPGSTAGLPVSILSSLECPPSEVMEDPETLAGRIESTVSSLLALLNITVDPMQSREHQFLSTVFGNAWADGRDMDIPGLIQNLQHPPFTQVGVMPLDAFFPEKDRMDLAMRLNGLIAAPGFQVWMQGEPLDIANMLHTSSGKPRISIFSIAHLNDAERMFFVSLLLNQMVAWMRTQSGTTSLRALLYMDEIFGFLPPTANPPSKKPMMTLLKQSRAFGLGVLLATQNPVDLDYKALSNIGTWFLGRLQTDRDKARVLDGLEGAASSQGAGFNRASMEKTLSALGNRIFLMNNVHEDHPQTFEVRWVLSYLRGPLARAEIKALVDPMRALYAPSTGSNITPSSSAAAKSTATAISANAVGTMVKPKINARVDEYFFPLPAGENPADYTYDPRILRAGSVLISDSKLGIDFSDELCELAALDPKRGDADWQNAEPVEDPVENLSRLPESGISYLNLPATFGTTTFFTNLKKEFSAHLERNAALELFKSPSVGAVSLPGESERDFRLRLVQLAREVRDERVSLLREDYAKRIAREQADVIRATDALEREKQQASTSKWSALANAGASILGALLGGGRKLSSTNLRRVTSAGGSISRSMNQASDVERATAKLSAEQEDVARLETELTAKISDLERILDPISETLEKITLKPLKKNITISALGIAWVPVRKS